MRQNVRKLDRDIQGLKQTEQKTKTLILQASKRAQRNPAMAKQANQEVRIFARELIRVRKQSSRLQSCASSTLKPSRQTPTPQTPLHRRQTEPP